MPRNVRNWWIEGNIDGRDSTLTGGPVSKDGGIDITIYQRDKGQVTKVVRLSGGAYGGTLCLEVTAAGEKPFTINTER